MSRSLRALPKAHLHLHLEAGMRPATLAELAERHGVAVPPPGPYTEFAQFEAAYVGAIDALRTEDDLRRVVREVVEDAAADGATYLEPALYPCDHRPRFGADERVVELVLDELARAGAEHGVAVGLMIAGDRTRPAQECEEQARLAVRYAGSGVVSFGLAAEEPGYPAGPFARAFAIAREAGLLSTPHAGELAGPEAVREALDTLLPDRIQHGVTAVGDPALLARLAEGGICLDVCPTSNVVMGVASLEEHPLPALLAAGVPCSINADDPLFFGPGLLDEYEACRGAMRLSDEQLAAVARASFVASGAARDVVRANVAAIDRWLATSAA
ncbi:adenosine deaminase [Conexibacter woesei]|uniref:Adenosine deaminase n=1 Tax=Conexibacter woesei (strain DSM 14684 / CCUG 47730 / CIP 108061 / JCM 11494 / NBRC 100937 / ID131577) TaxID=469383 RepID=D3F997_CONWI|nr:adenosine deaminase [Conexibacter woesei]ADB49064.1 adenosine deaminase [Conexibacter woesei DSM 14684]